MSSNAIAGAVIFAKDLAKLARFYESVLSADVVHEADDHVVLASGPVEVVIHAIPEPIARGIDVREPPELREETPIKLVVRVASLADARTTAVALGGGLLPRAREWSAAGFRACDGWDPEGNVVQFREHRAGRP